METTPTTAGQSLLQCSWALSRVPFINMIVSCLRIESGQQSKETFLQALYQQIQREVVRCHTRKAKLPYRMEHRDCTILRMGLINHIYKDILKPSRVEAWETLLFQVLFYGIINPVRERLIYDNVYDFKKFPTRTKTISMFSISLNKIEFYYQYLLISTLNLHQKIKVLEHKYDVLTQEVRAETAFNKFGPQTRQNVINKMNAKLAGLNYKLESFIPPNVLIMGFETAQGGGGDGPVTIGFSANMTDDYQKYSGGYVYVERGKDGDVYGSILKRVLLKVGKQHRKNQRAIPSNVVIFFSGVTEGQYALINEVYSNMIEEAFVEMKQAKPTMTLIATSKKHNERLYLNKEGSIQNPPPETTVDHTIVSSQLSEFYMTAAVACQGTAKITEEFAFFLE
ncbi:unnamed protein product [Caenorhabditis brenneri]